MRTQGSQNRATPARRRALLEAAVASFAERGLNQTTMDEVARLAGVSRGAVYHHFSTREELFAAAFADSVEQILHAIDQGLRGLGEAFGIAEGIQRVVQEYLAWHEREPARGLVVRKGLLDEHLESHLGDGLASQRNFVADVVARFEPFRREGAFGGSSDEVLVAIIVGPSRDFIGSWYKLRARDPERAALAMRDARAALPAASWAAIRGLQSAAARPDSSARVRSDRPSATSSSSPGSLAKS